MGLTLIRKLSSDLTTLTHEARHFENFLALRDDLLQFRIGHLDGALGLDPMDSLRNNVIFPSQLVQLPQLSLTIDGEYVTRIRRKSTHEITARRQFICGERATKIIRHPLGIWRAIPNPAIRTLRNPVLDWTQHLRLDLHEPFRLAISLA